jgi:hypothetical protein
MRTRILMLSLMLAPHAVAAQQKVDIHRSASPTPSVRLMGAFSSVKVIGWDRDSIALTGAVGAGSRLEGGPNTLSGPVSGMKFFLEAAEGASITSNKLELRVPRQARVWIKAGSADVEAQGVTGGLDLNIVGGSVRVNSKSARELLVESMDGNVTVSGNFAYARIKTATGDIGLEGGADDVSGTTVSGAITVGAGSVERARFESVTGPIVFGAEVTRGGDVRLDTHSGAIELRLVPGASLEVDAASITGLIENQWSRTRPIAGREGRGMELATSSGTAGARVLVRSFKGNVRLAVK